MQIAGSVALVTGATGGIGRATAIALTRAGADVVVTGRNSGHLAGVGEMVGAKAVQTDLLHPDAPDRLVAEVERVAGPIGLLVNAAGVGRAGPLIDTSVGEVDSVIRVDLVAPVLLTRLVLPGMLARGRGRIVLMSSIAGLVGVRNESVYSAAKGGLNSFADSLSDELAGTGVGVTVVAPGPVATDFFTHRGKAYTRRWPRPVSTGAVAAAICDGIIADRRAVVIPRWLEFAARMHGVAPGLYRALSSRFG
jgi:short-subunit dehydrogenase